MFAIIIAAAAALFLLSFLFVLGCCVAGGKYDKWVENESQRPKYPVYHEGVVYKM